MNSALVRGLDYYTKTVFEITSGNLGAQNTIGGGGRFDGLIKELGGPDLPCIGFATGIERIIQTMIAQHVSMPERKRPDVLVIPLGKEALLAGFSLVKELRNDHVMAEVDVRCKKLKQAMQIASEDGVKYVIVLGENELKEGKVELKEMATGNKIMMAIQDVANYMRKKEHAV